MFSAKEFLNISQQKPKLIMKQANALRRLEVAIILGHYNGADYLKEQINSILDQTYKNFHLFIFDDNSTVPFPKEALQNISEEQLQNITICLRPVNVGFAKNFLNALGEIIEDFGYFAFCDQDDIWLPDKLERSINKISESCNDSPTLYCSRTQIVHEASQGIIGLSPIFRKKPSFKNALVQNIGGGNTMMLNKKARELIVKTSGETNIPFHDWWCYQIISGAGGRVIYDPTPTLKYRKHSSNLAGENITWPARIHRIKRMLRGHYSEWNSLNIKSLENNSYLLTDANKSTLHTFKSARNAFIIKRLYLFTRLRLYRQTLLGNLGLIAAILLKKV